jgi:hypothetical protein
MKTWVSNFSSLRYLYAVQEDKKAQDTGDRDVTRVTCRQPGFAFRFSRTGECTD